jgi:filamentous hemagglutinin family protein
MNNNNYNNNTGSIIAKMVLLVAFLLGATATTWALPSVAATNLQSTTGVVTAVNGTTLNVTAPDRSILSWQNFGGGTDLIAAGDTISYVLPGSDASVLNIVGGANKTAIDGAITSNGNVFILNPNGVVLGNGSRFDVNSLYVSTSDNAAFAGFYFQANGKLPSQDGLNPAAGSITVNGSSISAPGGVRFHTKSAEIGNLIAQGNLVVTADGGLALGVAGTSFVTGDITINNPTGTTNLSSPGNSLIVTGNITVNSTSGFIQSNSASNVSAKKLTVTTTGDVGLGKVNVTDVVASGNNIVVGYASGISSTFTGNATSSATVTAPGALTVNYTGSGAGDVLVNAAGPLTLGKVVNNGTGNTNFIGSSVTDSQAGTFVYGPTGFTATGGNITLTKGNSSFGPLSLTTAGDAVVYESATTNFNRVNVGKLVANSEEGFIEALPGAAINTPVAVLNTPGNVTLANSANTIGNLTVNGGNVTVANTGPLVLGNVTASGTLAVTTSTFITQAADAKISAAGATNFTGTTVTASNAGNQFGALTVDVGTGTAAITEESTLNLAGLKAGTAALRSGADVITTGTGLVMADTFNIIAGAGFAPGANFKTVNPLTVLANGKADLSLLSLVTNLAGKAPTIIAVSYVPPAP